MDDPLLYWPGVIILWAFALGVVAFVSTGIFIWFTEAMIKWERRR